MDEITRLQEIFKKSLEFGSKLIFDTNLEFQINEQYGDAELIFKSTGNSFRKGSNLIKRIFEVLFFPKLVLHNKVIDDSENIKFNILNSIYNFGENDDAEHIFQIIGENKYGKKNILFWKITRHSNLLTHYIKTIGVNSVSKILNIADSSFDDELLDDVNTSEEDTMCIFDMTNEGFIITKKDLTIKFINNNIKSILFSKDSALMFKANFKGKKLEDLFVDENTAFSIINAEIINSAVTEETTNVTVTIRNDKYQVKISAPIDSNDIFLAFLPYKSNFLQIEELIIKNKKYEMQHSQMLIALKQVTDEKQVLANKNNDLVANQRELIRQNSNYIKQLRLFQLYLDNVPIPIVINNFPGHEIEYANIAFCGIAKIDKKNLKTVRDETIFAHNDLLYMRKTITEHIEQEKQGFLIVETDRMQLKQLILRDASLKPIKLIRIFHKFPTNN